MSSPTTTMEAADKRLTKHGFPKGFRFVPTHLELITILSHWIQGRPLHPKVAAIFHDLNILEYHPEQLHDQYEHDKEHRYIYFFSRRQLQKTATGDGPAAVHKKRQRGASDEDEDDNENEPRPVRLAKGGGWKPSGGGHVLRWPKDKGGFVAGKMVTMVFYEHRVGGEQVKSQWGMHEFTVPKDPRQLAKPIKGTRSHELALYRLYKLKSDDMESDDAGAGSNLQTPANVSAAYGHFSAPAVVQPSFFGNFASTSRMPPPKPQQQQQQHRVPNAGHPQHYNPQHHHHQYNGFGAAPPRYAHQQQQVHTMAMPPAYGAGGMPGRQLLFQQFARPLGVGLPGPFAGPPAQMPALPPAAAHPAASHQHARYAGAGQQEASHSGEAAPVPMPMPMLPPAAEAPAAEELLLAPMAEEPAGQHVQFAEPPLIPADDNDGAGMLLDLYDDENCLFTIEELLCGPSDEPPPPTQQGDDN